jgi:uncharacterized protein YcbK (DUF882 family)
MALFGTNSRDVSGVDTSSRFRSTRESDSYSNSSAFAATLASAMNTPAPPPPPPPERRDANSELDARSADASVGANDRRSAFAAAAEARSAGENAPVTHTNSDTDALNPEFRTRLNRVITRMREEYGHDVEIVEGFRPQSRQNFLFEQGRTRPGDVVTWTKSSKHTLGLAADLKIDGSYDNPEAYQQLAQIAAQEGLRTLGARDPGHIELPNRGGAAAWGSLLEGAPSDSGVSRAVGLALGTHSSTGTPGTDGVNGLLSHMGTNAGSASSQGFGNGAGSGQGFGQRERQSIAEVAKVATVATVAHVADVAHVATVVAPGLDTAQAAVPVPGSDAAARVGHLLDVRDATPAQPLSHVTLDVDNGTGAMDRITVQLRGGAVDTAISVSDVNRADRLSLRVGELQHALERQGLDAGAIRVGSTSADNSAGWNPRNGGDTSGQQGRSPLNHRDHRQDADDARQRSRREQPGANK